MKVIFKKRDGYKYDGTTFARVDKKVNREITWPETCKETFSQVLWEVEISKRNRAKHQGRYRILLSSTNHELIAERIQDFLNAIEAELGFGKTKTWQVSAPTPEDASVVLVDFSPRWATSSPLLHLFLLLIRNGSGHDPKKPWRTTLARFRRSGSFHEADQAQFMVTRKVMDELIATKGRIVRKPPSKYFNAEGRRFSIGEGIVQYAYRRQTEIGSKTMNTPRETLRDV